MRRLLVGAGLALVAFLALCEFLGSGPPPTPERIREICAAAPDPEGCFAAAVAKAYGAPLDAEQREIERRAASGS